QCCVCQSSCSYLTISDQMKPQEQMFFKDPINIIHTRLEHIAKIAMFQRKQKERVIAFHKHKFVEMERRLKEVSEQCHRQVSELRKENAELKKPLSQRRKHSQDDITSGCHIPRNTHFCYYTSEVRPCNSKHFPVPVIAWGNISIPPAMECIVVKYLNKTRRINVTPIGQSQ
ncbi:hypothetical protein QTP86_025347, partial [Hemibagrus guttatus]